MKFLSTGYRSIVLFITALGTASSVRSAETEAGVWTISPSITSHYLFRGVDLGGTAFQPWVDYTQGNLSLGLWSSFSLEDGESGDSDPEIDLYGSYTFTTESGKFSLVPGFYLYTYPDAERSNGLYSATFEPSLAAVFTAAGIQFTPKIYYDVMLKGATYEITAAIAVPLTSLGTELDFSASAGTFKWDDAAADTTPAIKNCGDYWTIGVAVPVQLTMRSKLTLGYMYSEGRNNFYKQGTDPREVNDDARGQSAVTLTYAITL
jgi:uncharacterized protein (TIGR02001 family)